MQQQANAFSPSEDGLTHINVNYSNTEQYKPLNIFKYLEVESSLGFTYTNMGNIINALKYDDETLFLKIAKGALSEKDKEHYGTIATRGYRQMRSLVLFLLWERAIKVPEFKKALMRCEDVPIVLFTKRQEGKGTEYVENTLSSWYPVLLSIVKKAIENNEVPVFLLPGYYREADNPPMWWDDLPIDTGGFEERFTNMMFFYGLPYHFSDLKGTFKS